MKTILVPIDFSDATPAVAAAAIDLAQAVKAQVVLLHVVPPVIVATEYSVSLEGFAAEAARKVAERLRHWQQEFRAAGIATEVERLDGPPAECIRAVAERIIADYLVVGSHGHGAIYDLLIGSTARLLLRKAPCPLLIVPVSSSVPRSDQKRPAGELTRV